MTHFDLTPLYRSSIGLDRMAHVMDSLAKTTQNPPQPNWPPYNIEKDGDSTYRITMAVAGFSHADLDISLHEQVLTINGIQPEDNKEGCELLYRGIAARQFERRFQLDDFIHIKSAELKDGLLHIHLVREIPEAMKPRKIEINSAGQLLDIEKRKKAS
jgi:molecular chaperone IbpA